MLPKNAVAGLVWCRDSVRCGGVYRGTRGVDKVGYLAYRATRRRLSAVMGVWPSPIGCSPLLVAGRFGPSPPVLKRFVGRSAPYGRHLVGVGGQSPYAGDSARVLHQELRLCTNHPTERYRCSRPWPPLAARSPGETSVARVDSRVLIQALWLRVSALGHSARAGGI